MCSAPNVYMFVYILIGTHMVPLKYLLLAFSNIKLTGFLPSWGQVFEHMNNDVSHFTHTVYHLRLHLRFHLSL